VSARTLVSGHPGHMVSVVASPLLERPRPSCGLRETLHRGRRRGEGRESPGGRVHSWPLVGDGPHAKPSARRDSAPEIRPWPRLVQRFLAESSGSEGQQASVA
jgi:hypothetical protein